jgi:hypothetical protein
VSDNKGAIELGGGKGPEAPEVTESMKDQIELRVRKRLKRNYLGTQFLAFDAVYGTWLLPTGPLMGWGGIFTTRGILLGGPENNFTIAHPWGGIPSDGQIEEAIRMACDTHRQIAAQKRAEMNGQGGLPNGN